MKVWTYFNIRSGYIKLQPYKDDGVLYYSCVYTQDRHSDLLVGRNLDSDADLRRYHTD